MIGVGVIATINLFFYKHKNKLLFLVSFLILLLYAGFRDVSVGTDTENYSRHFDLVSSGIALPHEILWYALLKLVYILGGSFQTVLILSSILVLLPVFYVSYKKSPSPLLSLFLFITLYYYFYSFNIIRQAIAMSFGLMAFYYIDERKSIKAYIMFAISLMFHYSSIIILPALISFNKTNNSTIRYLSYIILPLSYVAGLFFGKDLVHLLQNILYSDYTIDTEFNLLGTSLYLLILNILYIIISFLIEKNNKWFLLFFFFVLVSNLTVRIPFANRFLFYYGISLIIFFPMVLYKNRLNHKYQVFLLLLLVCYSLINLYSLWGRGGIFPYTNVLF